MSQGVAKDLANALDSFGPIAWLNNKCADGALVKAAAEGVVALKDKVVDGCSAAKENVVAFAKDPLGKAEKAEPEVALEKAPKLGISAERAIAIEAANSGTSGLGTQTIEAPSQATFASIAPADLAHVNGIRETAMASDAIKWDTVQVSQADIGIEGSVSSVGAGMNAAVRQQQQMAIG